MKKLILILFCLTSMFCYSQDTTKKENTKVTFKDVYEDAKTGFKDAFGGLRDLAGKLEGPAKHVYNVYVNQYLAEGLAEGIGSLFAFIFFLTIALRFYKEADYDDNVKQSVFFTLSALGALITLLYFIYFLSNGLMKIINPEYYAIQEVIKIFKK